MMQKNQKKNQKKKIAGNIVYLFLMYLLFMLSRLIYFAMNWSLEEYGEIPFGQIVFHLKVPLKGTSNDIIMGFISGFLHDSLIVLIVALIFAIVLSIFNLKQKKECLINISFNCKKKVRTLSIRVIRLVRITTAAFVICNFVFDLVFVYNKLGIGEYLRDMRTPSTIFEDYYVDPAKADITFPEYKKNLIYIFLESMEVTYSSKDYKGALDYDLIPNLSKLAVDNQCFSGGDYLNGAETASDTTWTVAGMVSETAGVPLTIPISGESYGEYSEFLPGAYSIGEILENNGYNQMLMVGSDATFGGRKNYFTQHGNYDVFDLYTAREQGKIPDDYFVWWGFEDEKLIEYAKESILDLAKKDEPFNFTMLTVDTHFQDGYVCDLCEDKYDHQIENVIACSDKQISAFIEWIKEQDFYDDTVIVISGDHNNMSSTIPELYSGDYNRKTYFNIINSDAERQNDGDREYTRFDIYPTTLAALGCTIDGERLGLGTNLYSGKQTIAEEMTITEMNNQLRRSSKFYNNHILAN